MKKLVSSFLCFIFFPLFPASAIFGAVETGDVASVQRFLERGGSVNQHRSSDGASLLHVALVSQQHVIALFLLARPEITVNERLPASDGQGKYPLRFAFDNGNQDVLRMLLLRKANPNQRDENGRTLLHFAVSKRKNINIIGRRSLTQNEIGLISILLDGGADPNLIDCRESTPLEEILELFNPYRRKRNEDIAMGIQVLKMFLLHGGNLNMKKQRAGDAILHCFAYIVDFNHPHKAHPLFATLLEIQEQRKLDYRGFERMMPYDINIVNEKGRTPLHLAVAYAHTVETIKALILLGAKVNIRDKWGNTPLHLLRISEAYRNEQSISFCPRIAQLLIEHNADQTITNTIGKTALQVMQEDFKEERLRKVTSGNQERSNLLHKSTSEVVKMLGGTVEELVRPEDEAVTPPESLRSFALNWWLIAVGTGALALAGYVLKKYHDKQCLNKTIQQLVMLEERNHNHDIDDVAYALEKNRLLKPYYHNEELISYLQKEVLKQLSVEQEIDSSEVF